MRTTSGLTNANRSALFGHMEDQNPACEEVGTVPTVLQQDASQPIEHNPTFRQLPVLSPGTVSPVHYQPQSPAKTQSPGSKRSNLDLTLGQITQTLQDFATERDWDQFHTPRNLVLALVGEVGELSEIFQWKGEVRPGVPEFSQQERVHLAEELSDVLLYTIRLAAICGVDMSQAVVDKIRKNAEKYPADQCRGSSAKYNTLPRVPPMAAPAMSLPVPMVGPTCVSTGKVASVMKPAVAAALATSGLMSPARSDSLLSGTAALEDAMKRKRFSDAQVEVLSDLAEQYNWSLTAVPQEEKDRIMEEYGVSKDRMQNFFNNRKPKDVKRQRPATKTMSIGDDTATSGDLGESSPALDKVLGAASQLQPHQHQLEQHLHSNPMHALLTTFGSPATHATALDVSSSATASAAAPGPWPGSAAPGMPSLLPLPAAIPSIAAQSLMDLQQFQQLQQQQFSFLQQHHYLQQIQQQQQQQQQAMMSQQRQEHGHQQHQQREEHQQEEQQQADAHGLAMAAAAAAVAAAATVSAEKSVGGVETPNLNL